MRFLAETIEEYLSLTKQVMITPAQRTRMEELYRLLAGIALGIKLATETEDA